MYKCTKEALQIVLKRTYDPKDPLAALAELNLGDHILRVRKGQTILNQGDGVSEVLFLLSGQAVIMNSILFSTSNIIDYVEPPHILGLLEAVTDVPTYTAYVMADTPCVLLRFSARDFLQWIRRDAELCYDTLVIQTQVASQNMDLAETHRVFPGKDILGRYLFLQARHCQTYTCPLTRKALSEKLNINLRSLYRYVEKLNQEGYLTLRHGKIVIYPENLQRLYEKYEDIVM